MPELIGLPGVKRKNVKCNLVRRISGALKVTRRIAIGAANDNGAINVWIDDAGNYRAAFMRYMSIKSSGEFTSKKALKEWLTEWWPHMQ